MNYIKAFINGKRSTAEYITCIVISSLMILAMFVMAFFLVNTEQLLFIVYCIFGAFTLGVACPLGTISVMIIKENRYDCYKAERKKAAKKLTTEFQGFKYIAHSVEEFEREIIHKTPIRFEAKMDKEGAIVIKALSTDGGIVHTETTYNYEWFNSNFRRI